MSRPASRPSADRMRPRSAWWSMCPAASPRRGCAASRRGSTRGGWTCSVLVRHRGATDRPARPSSAVPAATRPCGRDARQTPAASHRAARARHAQAITVVRPADDRADVPAAPRRARAAGAAALPRPPAPRPAPDGALPFPPRRPGVAGAMALSARAVSGFRPPWRMATAFIRVCRDPGRSGVSQGDPGSRASVRDAASLVPLRPAQQLTGEAACQRHRQVAGRTRHPPQARQPAGTVGGDRAEPASLRRPMAGPTARVVGAAIRCRRPAALRVPDAAGRARPGRAAQAAPIPGRTARCILPQRAGERVMLAQCVGVGGRSKERPARRAPGGRRSTSSSGPMPPARRVRADPPHVAAAGGPVTDQNLPTQTAPGAWTAGPPCHPAQRAVRPDRRRAQRRTKVGDRRGRRRPAQPPDPGKCAERG